MSNNYEETVSTVTAPTTITAGNNTGTSNDTSRSRNYNSNKYQGSNRNQTNYVGSDTKNWEGAKPELGAVFGLKVENLNKKVSFEISR